jgi:hypothetical protein
MMLAFHLLLSPFFAVADSVIVDHAALTFVCSAYNLNITRKPIAVCPNYLHPVAVAKLRHPARFKQWWELHRSVFFRGKSRAKSNPGFIIFRHERAIRGNGDFDNFASVEEIASENESLFRRLRLSRRALPST